MPAALLARLPFLARSTGALAALIFMCTGTPAYSADWAHYTNARFGFSIDVPASGFEAEPSPDNGDGQAWTAVSEPSTITVYGSNGYDFAEEKKAARDAPENSYFKAGKTWFVASGLEDGRLFYRKMVKGCNGATIVFQFDYRQERKRAYVAMIGHVASTLKVFACH